MSAGYHLEEFRDQVFCFIVNSMFCSHHVSQSGFAGCIFWHSTSSKMAGLFSMRLLFGFFFIFAVQSADHFERRTRSSRRSSLTDSELRNKLDSIISMLGKLNSKIDEQEQRLAVLSRKVNNIDCKGEPKKGMLIYYKPANCGGP